MSPYPAVSEQIKTAKERGLNKDLKVIIENDRDKIEKYSPRANNESKEESGV